VTVKQSIDWGVVTKGELKSRCSTWQSWRTQIRKHSAQVMNNSCVEYKCQHCGYTLHNEICHHKAVSDFDDDSTLNQINDINNLMYLCPTHHWEFDNGFLKI
jgi:predicted restriction endonuclease